MKKTIFISLLAVSLIFTISACSNSTPRGAAIESNTDENAVYTCTMHPEVQSDKSGNCPKCGMELVKMEQSNDMNMHEHSDTMHDH